MENRRFFYIKVFKVSPAGGDLEGAGFAKAGHLLYFVIPLNISAFPYPTNKSEIEIPTSEIGADALKLFYRRLSNVVCKLITGLISKRVNLFQEHDIKANLKLFDYQPFRQIATVC